MELCSFPRCRQISDLVYIGRELCHAHYEQICEADNSTEKRLLKKIGLMRNNDGKVVPITVTEEK